MSINITVHGSPVKATKHRKFLIDEEREKKELLIKRKKLRLEQVRQKSKELAKKVCHNADIENKKQIKKIEEKKAEELRQWYERIISKDPNDHAEGVFEFGYAHKLAAEAERQKKFPNSKMAKESPGKGRKPGKLTVPAPKKIKVGHQSYKDFCAERGNLENSGNENSSKAANMGKKDKDYRSGTQHLYPEVHIDVKDNSTDESTIIENILKTNSHLPCQDSINNEKYSNKVNLSSSSLSSSSSICYTIDFSKKSQDKRNKVKLAKTPSIIMALNDDSNSSAVEIEDTFCPSNIHISKVYSKSKPVYNKGEKSKKHYDASDYKNPDTSNNESTHPKPRFTKISELIKQHDGNFNKSEVKKEVNLSPTRNRTESSQDVNEILADKKNLRNPSYLQSDSRAKILESGNLENILSYPPKDPITLKPCTKTSTKSLPSSTHINRVQFYDYKNKFSKSYEPSSSIIQNEKSFSQMNAMEEAELDRENMQTRQRELEKMSKKCEERSQRALEREQIRRDYENLTAKLDAITKNKGNIQGGANLLSDVRQKQLASAQQNKMNNAIENVLNRPVLITCPEVRDGPLPSRIPDIKRSSTKDLNLGCYPDILKGDNISLNSSDSCASILLNYVDNQSKKISQDINNCQSLDKVRGLRNLLNRINSLRSQLLEEIEKSTNEVQKDGSCVGNVMESIGTLRRERENILSEQEKENKNLEKREKKIKKQEEILEKKIKDFYEMKKALEKEEDNLVSSDSIILTPKRLKTNKPVEIIIKVKDDTPKRTKSSSKSPRKRSTLIDLPQKKKKKTPVKKSAKETLVKKIIEKQPENKDNSGSTSYYSPPEKIQTTLTEALEESERIRKQQEKINKIISDKPKTKVTLKLDENKKSKHLQEKTPQQKLPDNEQSKKVIPDKKDPQKNVMLTHYIQRLLGMSRQSIDMLGVSSSEIATPSSSVVNTTANQSSIESEIYQRTKMERLQKFIEDNYSFLNEMEESIRTDKSISASNDSSIKAIEEIWMKTLKKKKQEKSLKPLKPILKKDKSSTESERTSPEQIPSTKPSEEIDKMELVSKYTELTENCNQRITELTEMINEVRKEKRRILEITLSSGSEAGRLSTEYLEFPDKKTGGSSQDSSKICDPILVDENEKAPLEKNKLTGVSRDSGISLSRPVTALDTRESPDIRVLEKTANTPQPLTSFEPTLKDIPKPPKCILPVQINIEPDKTKKIKPPASMSRYSPQLVEDPPHELSTILEVETPATSRITTSIKEKPVQSTTTQPPVEIETETQQEKLDYRKFLTFEEYVKLNKLEIIQFDPETSSKLPDELEEALKLLERNEEVQFEEFPSLSTYLRDKADTDHEDVSSLIESLKLLSLSFRKFPTHSEYIKNLGISRQNMTESNEAVTTSESTDKKGTTDISSSVESLPDVVAELKRRNIIKHSFRRDTTSTDTEDNKQTSEDIKPCASEKQKSPRKSESEESIRQHPKFSSSSGSPKKKKKSPTEQDDDILSGVERMKSSSPPHSHSDEIAKDFEKMGLNWASVLLKKSHQSQAIGGSSTSSSFVFTHEKRDAGRWSDKNSKKEELNPDNLTSSNETLSEGAGGKPLNLREFLARELQKHTSTSASITSEDSLAMQFIRSLLESSTTTTKPSSNEAQNAGERQRTSTPVTMSQSPSKGSDSSGVRKLFSGESQISSVRDSHSEKSVSKSVEFSVEYSSSDNSKKLSIPKSKLVFNFSK